MLVGETTFVWDEIVSLLVGEGMVRNSPRFHQVVRNRFIPTDMTNEGGQSLYIENPEYCEGKTSALTWELLTEDERREISLVSSHKRFLEIYLQGRKGNSHERALSDARLRWLAPV